MRSRDDYLFHLLEVLGHGVHYKRVDVRNAERI